MEMKMFPSQLKRTQCPVGLRRLAEIGVLSRKKRGRRVVFCPGRWFYELAWEYKRQLRQAEKLPPAYRNLLEYLLNA